MDATLLEIMKEFYDDFVCKQKNLSEIIMPNSFPIVWFGNLEKFFCSKIKVITIGLNPSNNEFPEYNKELRFPGARVAFEKNELTQVYNSLNGYFDNNRAPYWEWFIAFERALSCFKFGVSYGGAKSRCLNANNYAIHIDLFSAIPTNPTFSKLKEKQSELSNLKLFDRLFSYLTKNCADSPVIILFSTSKYDICKKFDLNERTKFYEMDDKVSAYKIENKIFIWGKPNIKPFQGVSENILKKAIEDICNTLEVENML